ncbi:MAG: hypothetical protein AAF846_00245 [Chloroflexota bacterium]
MALPHEINRFNKLMGEALTDESWRGYFLNDNNPSLWFKKGFDEYLAKLLGQISANNLTDFTELGLRVIQENYRESENPFDKTLREQISPEFIRVIKRLANSHLKKNDVAIFYFSSDWDEREIPRFIKALNAMLFQVIKTNNLGTSNDIFPKVSESMVRLQSFERTNSEWITIATRESITASILGTVTGAIIYDLIKHIFERAILIMATLRERSDTGSDWEDILARQNGMSNALPEEPSNIDLNGGEEIRNSFAHRFLLDTERFAMRTKHEDGSRIIAFERNLELERMRMGGD